MNAGVCDLTELGCRINRCTMGTFYADCGPILGPMLYKDAPATIGVLESPGAPSPIALAICIGPDPDGVALWRVILDDIELSGLWVIVDNEFRRAP